MIEQAPLQLNLTIADHTKIIDRLIDDENFRDQLVNDPVDTLTGLGIELSEADAEALSNTQIGLPSVEHIQAHYANWKDEVVGTNMIFVWHNYFCLMSESG